MASPSELSPNAALIGVKGSRDRLATPALVLDLDAVEHNIARMTAFARDKSIGLRPHVKTHKSVEIARRQLAAGARGVSAATLGEAAVMVEGGIKGVLITSPVVPPAKIEALIALNRRADGLMVTTDSMANLEALEAAAKKSGQKLRVVIDVDVGLKRTGAESLQSAVALAQKAAGSDTLILGGVQGYAGHLQHIKSFTERRAQSNEALRPLAVLKEQFESWGIAGGIVSGAGTGTYAIDTEAGVLDELQVGSYVVMDVEYDEIEPVAGGWPFRPALFVAASVISANHAGHVTIDAGLKCFATDGPLPRVVRGAPAGATYGFMGDEHGKLSFAKPGDRLPLGALVECFVPHCDPTINLYDVYHCVRGDMLVELWPVDARGRH
jgi:D-serine deaminase-like pyridoxal phosphate-dependent protein